MKVTHRHEFIGACIQENVTVSIEDLVLWLLWCVSRAAVTPVNSGRCKKCREAGSLYRGGICLHCTKRLTGSAHFIMETSESSMARLQLAMTSASVLLDRDKVRRLSA